MSQGQPAQQNPELNISIEYQGDDIIVKRGNEVLVKLPATFSEPERLNGKSLEFATNDNKTYLINIKQDKNLDIKLYSTDTKSWQYVTQVSSAPIRVIKFQDAESNKIKEIYYENGQQVVFNEAPLESVSRVNGPYGGGEAWGIVEIKDNKLTYSKGGRGRSYTEGIDEGYGLVVSTRGGLKWLFYKVGDQLKFSPLHRRNKRVFEGFEIIDNRFEFDSYKHNSDSYCPIDAYVHKYEKLVEMSRERYDGNDFPGIVTLELLQGKDSKPRKKNGNDKPDLPPATDGNSQTTKQYEEVKVTVEYQDNNDVIVKRGAEVLATIPITAFSEQEKNEGKKLIFSISNTENYRITVPKKGGNVVIEKPVGIMQYKVVDTVPSTPFDFISYVDGVTGETKEIFPVDEKIGNFVNKFLLGTESADKSQTFKSKLKTRDSGKIQSVNEVFCTELKDAIRNDEFLKQKIAETDPKKLEEFASKITRAIGEIKFAYPDSKAKDKGATFVENIGMKNGASFRKSLVDFVVSAFYSLITLDSTPLRNWSKNKAQIIVHDANKFEDFLKEVPSPHAVEKGKSNLRKAFEEIEKASSGQARS